MKKLILFGVISVLTGTASAQTWVNGYMKRDGTYVAPHMRSAPDNTRLNNYGTQGNINPYTGARGTQNPYPQPSLGGSLNTWNSGNTNTGGWRR
jgi:hypothetical protein